ncbi:hypothetical protein HQ590_05940 [bacterium]|nr:hypothetical protein [bacterium]
MASRSNRRRSVPAAALSLCRSVALSLCGAAVLSLCLAGSTVAAPAADEAALLTLWTAHQQNSAAHAAVAEACAQFDKSHAGSPLVVVSRGLAAWHLLKIQESDTARPILESMLSATADPLPRAGQLMARHLLTRLDREQVVAGLRTAYGKTISFPESLAGILPATDRWGQPWVYRRGGFKHLDGLAGQAFVLESPTLKETSDLARALKIPYGSRITWRPERSDAQSTTFRVPGRDAPVVFAPGTGDEQVTFVWAGDAALLLSDGDHWLLVPRPR